MADYSELLAGNPYFTPQPRSNLSTIGSMLANLGAGIAGSGAQGQPWFAGIAPGAAMASGALSRQKEQDDLEEARRFQMGLHLQQLKQLQDDRDIKNAGIAAWVKNNPGANGAAPPSAVPGGGMNVQPNPVQMGQGTYTAKVAGSESGGRYDIANGMGSGAYGKYQFMPDTWAGVAKAHPDLGLPFNMKQATPDQQEAAMKAFTADNAGSLKAGGFDPNPANLYLAHRFGTAGAGKVLSADPNTPVASLFPPVWAQQNPDMQGKTVGQFTGAARSRYGVLPPYEGPGMGDNQNLMPGPQPPPMPPSASPVLPPFQIPGQPQQPIPTAGLQPNVVQGDSTTPTPQVIPAQFTPPPALPAPGPPPVVPRPTQLPPAEANQLNNLAMTKQFTGPQLEEMKNKRLNEIHHDQQTAATEAWKQQNENYRFNRGEMNKQDRWEMINPQAAQAMGLPPNVQFQRNKSGEIKPVRDTKEVDKDISPLYAAPDVQAIVNNLSPVDRAAFNAATKLGDHKGAATILTKGQTGLTEEQQKLTGQALLDTLPFGDKENVTGLVEGRIKPSDLSKRSGNGTDINRYIALAQRVDSGYTPNDAGARNAFETKYMVNGPGGQTLQAANTVMPHLETWLRLQTALNNGDSQTINTILNAAKKQFGDAKVTSAEAASELYGTEVAKAIRGSGALNEKEELAAKAMTNASRLSPDQAKGIASTLTEMMMGRVHVLQDTAVHMHGVSQEKANNYMLPASREALDRISKGDFSGGKTEPPKMRPPLERFQR